MEFVLQFTNIGKVYQNRVLFKGVNLNVSKGEVIGIKGPSGIGKSTLLKMAAKLVQPTWGNVCINNQRIGYVFQEPRLLPWYTAFDNIVLPLTSIGISKQMASKKTMKYLDEMGLSGFEHLYPKELSGGMKQRVSIARALAIEPGLLLLDEPFTGLDPVLRDSVRTLVSDALKKSNASVIHVTHTIKELIDKTDIVYTLSADGLNPNIL